MKYYLAIDLGATSGRHVVSFFNGKVIVLEEIHRFKTGMDDSKDGLIWDLERIYNEILIGIKKAFGKYNNEIVSLAIDSWGVDYVLLDENDKAIKPFYAYRNVRNEKVIDEVHSIINFDELYKKTGIQFATFNTIYQLYSDNKTEKNKNAKDMLMLPEYFSFLLTGKKAREYTNASTTGLINLTTNKFDEEIIKKLDLPSYVNKDLVKPGYVLGRLNKKTKEFVNGDCNVILCATHDTASAFESIETKENSVIISSGTWSLLGIKSKTPIVSKEAQESNFTNEGGPNYIRFLKNIMGLWIANQLSVELNVDIPSICKNLNEPNKDLVFDVNDASLLNPKSMKQAILKLLSKNDLSNEELFSSTYYSLALCYKEAIKNLEKIINSTINTIYIIGGGANNKYLNNLVKEVTKKEVIALPIEATCLGNIKIQIKANS